MLLNLLAILNVKDQQMSQKSQRSETNLNNEKQFTAFWNQPELWETIYRVLKPTWIMRNKLPRSDTSRQHNKDFMVVCLFIGNNWRQAI